MTDTIVCVLYACQCGHPESEHDGEDGACMAIVEINDLGAELCNCSGYTVVSALPPAGIAQAAEGTGQ